MAGEHSSGVRFKDGDLIKSYRIEKVFDPGAFAFSARAISSDGRKVFLKKYKKPGGASPWYQGFVHYQNELKHRVQGNDGARSLCYEFIEFFELKKATETMQLRAFYQVFEWVDGGIDLRQVIDRLRASATAFTWEQRVIFARVLLAGVNALHKAGIIHTDLKPENFFLLPEPAIAAKHKLRVIDMDFSLLIGKKAPWHGHDGYVGTPLYMSPEHLTSEVPIEVSDAFTSALIVSELLTGSHPADGRPEQYNALATGGGLAPINITRPIPDVVDLGFLNMVLTSALRPEHGKRPTVEQMLHAVSGRLAEFDGRRPTRSTIIEPPRPPSPPKPPVTPIAADGTKRRTLNLSALAGDPFTIGISTTIGNSLFRNAGPDFVKFMSAKQFNLQVDAVGTWTIRHCEEATNKTTINGVPITGATSVVDGIVVAIGKSGKCPVTLRLA